MNKSRHLTAAETDALRTRLREYSRTYPDSDFLDNACQYADAGNNFTRENAAKVEDALDNWEQRLRSPSYDPDRPPHGTDPHLWKLATLYRARIEDSGWRCPSRRLICAELARITERDHLRENYAPWNDEPGTPGWVRMLRAVIICFTDTEVDGQSSWYAHEALAQPGTVTGIIAGLTDSAKLRLFDDHASPVNASVPSAERQAAVRAYITTRKAGQKWA